MMTHCKRAGAVILNNEMDKCLMVFQKSSLFWGIPKGSKLDKDEDSFVCMVREVKEEVGLDLNYIKFEILDSVMVHVKSYIYIIKIFLDPLPICSPPMEDGNENHEIEKVEWVLLEDAYSRKNNSITRNALHKVKKYLSKNNVSNHTNNYNYILDMSTIY
jgi:8-oxo-dGTP pyrophosphatase MutT (NUDIX family)